ncbi:unnamed protein product [Effrenium voratum]|nr:unnamed protein product [Effrenium voratum]
MGAATSKYTKFGESSNYTILMLGQTGSGKTSLLNFIASYRHVLRSVNEDDCVLSREELQNFAQERVSDMTLEHALEDQMASKTCDAKLYQLSLASNCHFNVIDTPGFGDTRGMSEDERHIKRILACIAKVNTINCVLITINGREARLNHTLRYVLSELTSILPQQVLSQVGVVFTNVESRRKMNFNPSTLHEVDLKDFPCTYVDNPFGEVLAAVEECLAGQDALDRCLRQEFTQAVQGTAKTLQDFFWKIHDFEPVLSKRFAELNEKREIIEALMANNMEECAEIRRLVQDLERHKARVQQSGAVVPLTRTVRLWRMKHNKFNWSHYVCAQCDCHSNCHTSAVISPFASIWCFFHSSDVCDRCGHRYENHRVTRAGWEAAERDENIEFGDTVDEAARQMEDRIAQANRTKLFWAQQLEEALEEYARLGLRDAFLRLLRSQKALLEQQLASAPDDDALKCLLDDVCRQLTEIEKASDTTCCICFDRLAETRQNLRNVHVFWFPLPSH